MTKSNKKFKKSIYTPKMYRYQQEAKSGITQLSESQIMYRKGYYGSFWDKLKSKKNKEEKAYKETLETCKYLAKESDDEVMRAYSLGYLQANKDLNSEQFRKKK